MGLVFGIISIVVGLFAGWVAGWYGVGVVVILAGLGIFFTIRANKNLPEDGRKRIGGIITGVTGILIGAVMMAGLMNVADRLIQEADKYSDVPYASKALSGLKSGGFLGYVMSAANAKPAEMSDSEYADELKREIDKINEGLKEADANSGK